MSWNFVSPNNFIYMSDMNFFAHFESGLRGIQSKTFEMVPHIIGGTCQCVIFLVVNLTGVEHITGPSARRRQPRTRTCSLKGSSNFCVNLEWERKNKQSYVIFKPQKPYSSENKTGIGKYIYVLCIMKSRIGNKILKLRNRFVVLDSIHSRLSYCSIQTN